MYISYRSRIALVVMNGMDMMNVMNAMIVSRASELLGRASDAARLAAALTELSVYSCVLVCTAAVLTTTAPNARGSVQSGVFSRGSQPR